jgi:hypothetical protein
MNEIDFKIEKAKVLNGFREILLTVNNDVELSTLINYHFFKNHGESNALKK